MSTTPEYLTRDQLALALKDGIEREAKLKKEVEKLAREVVIMRWNWPGKKCP